MEETGDLLATRRSLLDRLKDARDKTGWQRFFDTYWKLLYRVALKSGLSEAEADDAVQETLIAVARHMPEFRYDPARCSFKSWLSLLLRQRIVHQFRKRNRPGGEAKRVNWAPSDNDVNHPGTGAKPTQVSAASGHLETVDQLADPMGSQLEALWDAEWQKHVLSTALKEVKRQVSDRQFQIFDIYVLQNWPVQEVARTLQVSTAQVYLARHRVGRLLKREIRKVEETGD